MKFATSFTFLIIFFLSHAKEEKRVAFGFIHRETTIDKTLHSDEAKFQFTFKNIDSFFLNAPVVYSDNGKQDTVKMLNGSFSILTTTGKHVFQVYLSNKYYEVTSDTIEINSKEVKSYDIYTYEAPVEIIVDKPVIYLYPEKTQNINVEVLPIGEFSMTYPNYKNGWNVTANPNGEIIYQNESYNYLFWEAIQTDFFSMDLMKEGFIVSKNDVITFLEDKLTHTGLTSKEQADFITFWAPQLMKHDEVFIHFHFNDDCDNFAELNISPEPDQVIRIYITWTYDMGEMNVTPQKIPKMKRNGFTVIEWGGQEINLGLINI